MTVMITLNGTPCRCELRLAHRELKLLDELGIGSVTDSSGLQLDDADAMLYACVSRSLAAQGMEMELAQFKAALDDVEAEEYFAAVKAVGDFIERSMKSQPSPIPAPPQNRAGHGKNRSRGKRG